MESKSKVVKSKSERMFRSNNQEDIEIQTRCRNTPLSRQPEEIVEIRYADGKDE